jgi:hypothetical protein
MKSQVHAGRFLALTVLLFLASMAAAQAPPTATELQVGNAKVTTYELNGDVVYVEGNTLVVKMSTGEERLFNVPPSRRFVVDGKELTVHELVPGTKLTATVTTTMTPITVRTITVKSGTVWHVMGNNVIITLPNGENKQFIVKDDTPFTVNGKPATVRDLKKGTVVFAEKVVEEPTTDIATNTTVVGQAAAPGAPPAAAPAAAQSAAPTGEPAAEPAAAATVESAPAVAQTAPAEQAPAPIEQAPATPKTASRVPLIVGVLLVAGILVIWLVRRGKS